ncbi:GNAT family N-acetyltransferase [Jeotgalibacillus salarius]|uniref:GNAT family N-acetyltransferase n=1 Tax=Jeotgalibacillus salarius TaxID=546023 RepID=A0A4Y8LI15_9BACL|nr:GNAT family N-acetyltransferase [Jeotgalibacillus salarius]TFE02384.1 GNAT family N-acetyltransferase [Jeotgalibacillus salarius]
MSLYQVQNMTIEAARHINEWTYEEPYSIYSMSGDPEDLDELMDGTYFAVYENDQLIGYFCYGKNAQVPGGVKEQLYEDIAFTDLGLGLHPELTGKGRGARFLEAIMDFGERTYGYDQYRLSVASFNERAIHLYEKAGFKETGTFVNVSGDRKVEFMVMKKAEGAMT